MGRLSKARAAECMRLALEKQRVHGLRFGQALWHHLPTELAEQHVGKDTDFFYCDNTQQVIDTFFYHFVETN